MPLRHFLIVFDVTNQRLIESLDLGQDSDEATRQYVIREREVGMRKGIEMVLIGADSLDTIRRTHSHYFVHSDADPFADLALPA